jgi:hypothetical protein
MKRLLIITTLLVTIVATPSAASGGRGVVSGPALTPATVPVITGISATSVTRSGRLVVSGSAFGAVQGDGAVVVGGLRALVTRWSDDSVTAYVPESAPVGTASVQIVTGSGASNGLPVQVTLRQAAGHLLWRFEVDAMYVQSRPVTGSDGTVYVNDIDGHLYALTPDGGLKWVLNGVGTSGTAIGPDDTVYVGNTREITAVNPDGTVKWRFVENPGAFILLGPSVGPDGNIYAVATSGIGILSLTPQGSLRWTIPEAYDRAIVDYQELAFGPGPKGNGLQMYFHANHHFRGVDSGGSVRFTVDGDGSQPVVGPDGTVYTHNWTIGLGAVLGAYDPSGNLKWTFLVSPNNTSTNPAVGPNGIVYVGWNLSSLYALTPKGTVKWHYVDPGILQDPVPSPTRRLVLMGGQPNYGEPGFFAAVGTRRGSLKWKAALPLDNGSPVVPFSISPPRFSRDGRTAYAATITLGVYDHSFLYAVSTGG